MVPKHFFSAEVDLNAVQLVFQRVGFAKREIDFAEHGFGRQIVQNIVVINAQQMLHCLPECTRLIVVTGQIKVNSPFSVTFAQQWRIVVEKCLYPFKLAQPQPGERDIVVRPARKNTIFEQCAML